jgi:hypothetical protein
MRFGMRALLLAVLVIAVCIQGTRTGLDHLHESKRRDLTKLGSGHAFLIHEDEVLLLRQGNAFGAFIPRVQNRRGEVVEYNWYYRTDGKGTLDPSDPAVQHGNAVGTRPTTGINVKFGPFTLQWSGCDKGWGWIYYHPSGASDPNVKPTRHFCLAGDANLDDIDAASPRHIYLSAAPESKLPSANGGPQPAVPVRVQLTLHEIRGDQSLDE